VSTRLAAYSLRPEPDDPTDSIRGLPNTTGICRCICRSPTVLPRAGTSPRKIPFFPVPHNHTILVDLLFRWGNSFTALFVPQRSILLGTPMVLWTLLLWWRSLCLDPTKKARPPQRGGACWLQGSWRVCRHQPHLVLAGEYRGVHPIKGPGYKVSIFKSVFAIQVRMCYILFVSTFSLMSAAMCCCPAMCCTQTHSGVRKWLS